MPFRIVIILSALLVPAQAVAQPAFNFGQLPKSAGTTANGPEALALDSLGFLWYQNTRWDGEGFRAFEEDAQNPDAVVGYVWDAITVSRDGRVWVGTDKGLNVFDYATAGFRHIELPRAGNGDPPWVSAIAESASGELWLATWGSGVYRYDPATDQARVYRYDPEDPTTLSHDTVLDLVVDASGEIWIATEYGGLGRYRPESDDFATFRHDPADAVSLCGDGLTALAEDQAGQLWVGTRSSGVCLIDRDRARFTLPAGLPEVRSRVKRILHDRAGRSWIATEAGLWVLIDGQARQVPSGSEKALADSHVFSMLEDRAGTIWFGTGQGISYLASRAQQISTLSGGISDTRTVSVTSLENWQDQIWVGTENAGLYRFDPADMEYLRVQVDLPSETVYDLAAQQSGPLWLGTGDGLVRYEGGQTTTFRASPGSGDGLESNAITSVMVDGNDDLWVLTDTETLHRMTSPGKFERWSREVVVPSSQEAASLMLRVQEHLSEPGILWISSFHDGLIRFDPTTGESTKYHRVEGDSTGLAGRAAFSSWSGKSGTIWIASGVGLARVGLNDTLGLDSVRHWFADDGLSSDIVRVIVPDQTGRLWLGTENGLSVLNPAAGVVHSVGAEYGASEDIYAHAAGLRLDDGRLAFGSRGGLVVFDPESIDLEPVSPPIRFVGLEVMGKPRRLGQALEIIREVALPYDENFLGISYAAQTLADPGSAAYRYRMVGVDPVWNEAGRRTYASYPALAPGSYTFEVESMGPYGGSTATLGVRVLPPWWSTPVARTVWVVLSLSAFFGAFQLRVRSLRRRTAELEAEVSARTAELEAERATAVENMQTISDQASELRALEQAKSRLFANISHEFRTPLTLIEGPLTDALESHTHGVVTLSLESASRMRRQAGRLTALVDQVLEVARAEANQLDIVVQHVDFAGEVRRIVQEFEVEAERRSQSLSFEASQSMEKVWCDCAKLRHIMGNLISNALKYTPRGGRVDVGASSAGEWHELVVRDTGIGIAPDRLEKVFDRFFRVNEGSVEILPGTGIGLSLVKDIVELMGGEVFVRSELGKGSEFKVRLPVWTEVPVGAEVSSTGLGHEPRVRVPEPTRLTEWAGDGQPQRGDLVLIVDDNDDVRAYVKECLAPLASVAEASNGAIGLRLAEELAPDVIVSDVMMPGMDGYSLIRGVRDRPELELTPVILLTARAEDRDAESGFAAGADAYVTKPFSARVLAAQVGRLIARQRQQRARLVAPESAVEDGMGREPIVRKARELVMAHLGESEYGVEALAADLAMSPRTLNRKLKEACGVGPQVFARTVRLFQAERLLREEGLGVAEAAAAVGYEGTGNFRMHFRRQFGILPGEV